MKTCLPCMVGLLLLVASSHAAEYFAAPDAKPFARGSRDDPFDLAAALLSPDTIRPGDTLWLLGGTYRGAFASRLRGLKDKPVTIRQAPGARAIIDCRSSDRKNALFSVQGDWSTFQGFEVTCSDPQRTTRYKGPSPKDLVRGGITCRASHVKFINLVVHDVADGFGFWSDGEGGEIYGCVIYNNGWQGADRGWGHGIYTQNERGVKRIVDNIIFNQFGDGIHCYGSKNSALNGFHLEGNTVFNNGSPNSPSKRHHNILVGGEVKVRGAKVIGNFTYADRGDSGIAMGYPWGPANEDAEVKDNYVAGLVSIKQFERLKFERNTILASPELVLRFEPMPRHDAGKYSWNQNTYSSMEPRQRSFLWTQEDKSQSLSWDAFRARTGFDQDSVFIAGKPMPAKVFVRPNHYEPGRANLTVFNWGSQPSVEVNLSGLLDRGQDFRIVSAQDFFGPPVVSGTYQGDPMELPMTPVPASQPQGVSSPALPVTEPEFGAFVVLPD